MTRSQHLNIRAGAIRTRLSELGGVGELNDEQRTELDRLRSEYGDVERRFAAAVIEEDAPLETRTVDVRETAEEKELRELRSRVNMGDYVGAAQEQRGLDGAAHEYNQANSITPGRFPLHLLVPELEKRAETDTNSEVNQGTWIDRLFNESMARALGVSFRSVSAGVASFPVTTAGATGKQRARMEADTAASWAVGATELKPKRNSTHLIFSTEDSYRLPGLEDSLRRDMQSAVMESVDLAIFEGDAGADGTDADITGLQTAANVVEKTLSQANKVKADKVHEAFVSLIDGRHATMLDELAIVSSVGANTLWESTILSVSSETASVFKTLASFLRENGIKWRTRGGIDTATSNNTFGAFVGRQRGIEGAGIAAVWDEGVLIRDPYTSAIKGEVNLTLCYFWDFALPRASNYARIKFVT